MEKVAYEKRKAYLTNLRNSPKGLHIFETHQKRNGLRHFVTYQKRKKLSNSPKPY